MSKVTQKSRTPAEASRGQRGLRGMRGAPGITPRELHAMIGSFEKMQADAAIQFKRIAQMQVQIDETLKALKQMGEKAGRQRKKR
ncbi:MAG: hypothetical protein GEU82_05200 [Luteitalea sp.]|nr:hypothetical protein [Luteitalea sp.]